MTERGFKDHFSEHSNAYAHYRPRYPAALFAWLAGQTPATTRCWDCATGSGQAAVALAHHFDQVIATDASAAQIKSTMGSDVISYAVAAAENSGLAAASIDLITVAQALHWFDIRAFFREADRVLKEGGLLAILAYNLLRIDVHVDAAILELYRSILNGYWPAERRLIEQGYAGIELPFPQIHSPKFTMEADWDLQQLSGYLNTWSAVKRYKAATGESAIQRIEKSLQSAWGDPSHKKRIQWPLTVRVAVKPLDDS